MILEIIAEYVVSNLIDKHRNKMPDQMVKLMMADDSLDALLKKTILPNSLDALKADYPKLQQDEALTEQVIAPAIAHVIYQTIYSGELSDAAAVQSDFEKLLAHDLSRDQGYQLRNLLDDFSEHFRRELAQHQGADGALIMQALNRFRTEVLTRLDALTNVSGSDLVAVFGKSKPRIFLSYARADDEPFVERLYHVLKDKFDVWWDRVSMPSRGLTFLDEIRKAIDDADRLLLVVGPNAITSDNVRAEWQHALSHCIPINPILRLGDFNLLPRELAMIDARDFSDDAVFDAQIELLIGQLEAEPGKLGSVIGAPSLPPQHIPRRNDLKPICDFAVAHTRDVEQAQQMMGVHGMGGVGKSVLVRALLAECDVRRAYPDGIYWITIGKNPRLESRQEQLGVALGDSPANYKNDAQGNRSPLAQMLENRTCLIVLDDVWERASVEAFDALGENCRLLYTTRNGEIALSLGVAQHRLTPMSETEALALLYEWTQSDHPQLPDVADRLGNLPLGLKLAGARIGHGMSVESWLEQFTRIEQIKLGRRSTDPQENLLVSLELSVNELSADDLPLYHALGLFPEGVGISQRMVTLAWQAFDASLTDFDCGEFLSDLVNLALLESAQTEATFQLHTLLRDYNCEKLGTLLPARHAQFIEYLSKPQQTWTDIASALYTEHNEMYLFYHLAYHLDAANYHNELYALLIGSPGWLQTKYQVCVGDTSYVADLELALASYSDPVTDSQIIEVIELITARQLVNARTDKYHDEMLCALVWLDQVEEAISSTRLRPNIKKRFYGLLKIYQTLKERDQPFHWLLDELQQTAYLIGDIRDKDHALYELATSLAQGGEYIHAQQVMRQIDSEFTQAYALHEVAESLIQAGERGAALQLLIRSEHLSKQIDNHDDQVKILTNLAVCLSQAGEREEALRVLDHVHELVPQLYGFSQSRIFHNLAVSLVQVGEYERSIQIVQQIDDTSNQVEALSALAVCLAQAGEYERAIQITQQIDSSARSYALHALAVILAKAGEYEKSERVAKRIDSASYQMQALSELAICLSQAGEREAALGIFDQAEQVAPNIEHHESSALLQLAVALAQINERDAAWRIFEDLASSEPAANLLVHDEDEKLTRLAVSFAQAKEYVRAEQVVKVLFFQEQAMGWLAASLAQEGEYAHAEQIAQKIEIQKHQVESQFELVTMLARANEREAALRLFNHTQQLIKQIENEHYPGSVAGELAVELAQANEREAALRLFDHSVRVAQRIESWKNKMKELLALKESLNQVGEYARAEQIDIPYEHMGDFLVEVENFDAGTYVATVMQPGKFELSLTAIQPDQDQQVFGLSERAISLIEQGAYAHAEQVAGQIENAYKQAEVLSKLIVTLVKEGSYTRAVQLVKQIGKDQSQILSKLVISLVEIGEYELAEQIVKQIKEAYYQAEALAKLVVIMVQEGNYARAVELAQQIKDMDRKPSALRELAISLMQNDQYVWSLIALGPRDIPEYIQFLNELRVPITQYFNENIWYEFMTKTLQIICWERQEWQPVLDVFAAIVEKRNHT